MASARENGNDCRAEVGRLEQSERQAFGIAGLNRCQHGSEVGARDYEALGRLPRSESAM